jgi:hypothetical protein
MVLFRSGRLHFTLLEQNVNTQKIDNDPVGPLASLGLRIHRRHNGWRKVRQNIDSQR